MGFGDTNLEEYIKRECRNYGENMVPVRAGFLERVFVKEVPCEKLHPNPEDAFCSPSAGPNHEFIAAYRIKYLRSLAAQGETIVKPIVVEKVLPDGYMILKGHHRWAAAMEIGIRNVAVTIVNLTQQTDIESMLKASRHDRRVTMDLDEVVFTENTSEGSSKIPGFLNGADYTEQMRDGIPSLMHYLSTEGYDIWVYSRKYYSFDYLHSYFERYSVRVDGVITGIDRKAPGIREKKKQTEKLFSEKYAETLHIDRTMVLRTFRSGAKYRQLPIEADTGGWARAVIQAVRQMRQEESGSSDSQEQEKKV